MTPTSDALILTLQFAPPDQARFEALRQAHFPPERNFIPAHLTLFHALPASELDPATHLLTLACAREPPMTVQVTGLRSLGRGVAYTLESQPLTALRAALAKAWHGSLTPQDRQGWRPHVTIQNKVPPPEAAHLLSLMQAAFSPFPVHATGLQLWRYCGGPWSPRQAFPFRAACQAEVVRPDGRA